MKYGFDVSKWQQPERFAWDRMAEEALFLIARASYGTTLDPVFRDFAKKTREATLPFGAYHFYRQSQPWEVQFGAFVEQLEAVDFRSGDLFPVLDLEDNQKYDGKPDADKFNGDARRLAQKLATAYGGCILYMSSYFPEWMDAPKTNQWKWILEPQYFHWLADYSKPFGEPRTPYHASVDVQLHQGKPAPSSLYRGGGNVDQNTVLRDAPLADLIMAPAGSALDPVSPTQPSRLDAVELLVKAIELQTTASSLIAKATQIIVKG